MRKTAATLPLLLTAVLLAGCASSDGAVLAEQQTPTPPTPSTQVETYAPDPQTANIQGSWAFDVTDIQQVVLDADTIVLAEVTGINKMGTFEFATGAPPKTRIDVKAQETMKGDFSPDIALYVPGGTVTLQQVFESQDPESSKKSGIADMDEKERRSSLVEYVSSDPVALEVGREYLFMLRHSEEMDVYAVAADGYGVFDVTGSEYTNRITGQTVTIEKLREMIKAEPAG